MFKNVLIAEDHQSANISVRKILEDMEILNKEYAYHCDIALTKIRIKLRSGEPFELLITDLFFDDDGQHQEISGGEALIAAARELQPDLKVLVFSAENKPMAIEGLISKLNINGYVGKGRNDAEELKVAIDKIYKNQQHFPAHVRQGIKQKNTHEFSDTDIAIVRQLANGMRQKDIPTYLEKNNIKPFSLSSLEKRLNHIRSVLAFSNNEQLIVFCKDMGII